MNEPKIDMGCPDGLLTTPRLRENDERVARRSARKSTPRWTIAFLRALERCGDVRASAEDAGIDHTTAYARRRAHAEFALAWDEALRAHEDRVEAERDEDVAFVSSGTLNPTLPIKGRGVVALPI